MPNSTINNEIILQIWPSEWNLPSLDPDCLTVLCFLKFSGLTYRIEHVTNPFLLLKNHYPRLIHNKFTYVGINDIIRYIKTIDNKDNNLSNSNYGDMLALVELFKQKFIPAFIDISWIDPENTYKVTRSTYGKHLKFPLSMIKLRIMANEAENFVTCNYRDDFVQYEKIKTQILIDAKECLNILSSKLNSGTFMFENQPTYLDSILFGYLSVLYKAPFIGSSLKNHLISCNNLCLLIKRINIEYFPLGKQDLEKIQQKEAKEKKSFINKSNNTKSDSKTNNNEDDENMNKERKQQILAVFVALSAMLIYAFSIGFIKIEIQSTEIVDENINLD